MKERPGSLSFRVVGTWKKSLTMSSTGPLLWGHTAVMRPSLLMQPKLKLCPYFQHNSQWGFGLSQGCPISPILFVLFMGRILRKRVSNKMTWLWSLHPSMTFNMHRGALHLSVKLPLKEVMDLSWITVACTAWVEVSCGPVKIYKDLLLLV